MGGGEVVDIEREVDLEVPCIPGDEDSFRYLMGQYVLISLSL